jgi:hypothetical protein
MGDFVKNEIRDRFEHCSVFELFKETQNEEVDEIKEDEKDTYLDSLSTDELNKFYVVMVRNNPNKDLKILKDIEKIVYDRVNEE